MNALMQRIENRRDDLITLTQDLIRIPTLNPPGRHYHDICSLVGERMSKQGWKVEMVRAEGALGDSDRYPRWNVVCRLEGRAAGDCVHFNSHHPEFRGAIEISATADEESGGYGGVAYLAERGFFDPARVQHVIIPEPLNKDRICLGHRGVWWAEIETKGHIAHGSMPFLGDCAVRHMGAVLDEMEATLFPLLAGKRTDMPVVPDGAKSSTLNINSIHGGEPVQDADYTGLPSACVPDRCILTIDRRFLIEEDIAEGKAEVARMMDKIRTTRPDFRYEIRDLFEVMPTMTPEDAPIVRTVQDAVQKVMGKPAEFVVSPGTYDQKHIDRIGRLKNCIAYGPGVLDLAHQPDEWIGVDDMVDSGKVMALTLTKLLT